MLGVLGNQKLVGSLTSVLSQESPNHLVMTDNHCSISHFYDENNLLTLCFRLLFCPGTEFKATACSETGIIIHLEIQEGKDAMKNKEYVGELKSQAACTKCLVMASASSNGHDQEDIVVDAFVGDSWFASVETALALMKEGYEFGGIVKTAHSGFPKSQLEGLMSQWPGGSYVVLTSGDLVATGYKYNSRKVICFTSSQNFESTRLGESYVARFLDSRTDNLRFR